jgi:hypothetical protein
MIRFCTLWVGVGAVFLAASPTWAQPPAAPPALDALAKLNQQFRVSYADARTEVLQMSYPVLLYDGSKLVLLVAPGKRLDGEPVPALYHRLKALAHLPFTVYLELRAVDGTLSDERYGRLVALRKLIAGVEEEFPTYDFGPHDPERQRRLVSTTASFVAGVIARRECLRPNLEKFAAEVGPDMHANTLSAAAVELGHHHGEIREWLDDLGDDERSRLRFVVCGSQMPRAGHRIVQLAAALIGEKGEGRRIVYAEAIYEEQRALNLLGTHRLDSESAEAFFGDPTKLDRDILSDGAARYVRDHFGAAKP